MPPVVQIPGIAKQYGLYDAKALPGMPYGAGQPVVFPFTNMAGTTKPKWTIAVPAAVDANSTYSLNIMGDVVSVPTGAATTQAQLSAMLLNAVRSGVSPASGLSINLNSTTNTITIESLNPGSELTVSSPSNVTTTNDLALTQVVASGEDAVIPFGRFVGRKFDYAKKVAGLIDSNSVTHAAGQDGYMVHGVTHTTWATMRTGRGMDAVGGYAPRDVMNVWVARGNAQGIWVECTAENDIQISDTFSAGTLFIATTAGNEGKLTKDSATYGGLSLGQDIEVLSASSVEVGKTIALITFDRLS